MKKLILLVPILMVVAGCAAKTAPPPPTQNLLIPIALVNIENTQVVGAPDEPSTAQLVKISKGDDTEESMNTVIDYTGKLHAYAKEVTRQLFISEQENAVMRSKLSTIKRYIILNQQPDYGAPVTTQPVY